MLQMLAVWIAAIARGWERFTEFAQVLWPLRFVVLVLVAVTVVLQVDQAQDVLFHVFAEQGWVQPACFLGALVLLAVQSWYWSRFLLNERARRRALLAQSNDVASDHVAASTEESITFATTSKTAAPPLKTPPLTPLEAVLPRILGAIVFWIAMISVWRSPQGYTGDGVRLWLLLLFFAAPAFFALAAVRRAHINRRPPPAKAKPASVGKGAFSAVAALRRARTDLPRLMVGANHIVPPPPSKPPPVAIGAAALAWGCALLISASTTLISPWDPTAVLVSKGIALFLVFGSLIGSIALVRSLSLPPSTKNMVITFSAINAVLFALSAIPPFTVWVGEFLGAGPVLILAGAIWMGTTCFFVAYPGVAYGLPVTTLLLASMALLGAVFGEYDNHTVRAEAETLTQEALANRPTLATAFDAWRAQAPCAGNRFGKDCKDSEVTLVIVASEGGASRAGYWTAMVLGALEDRIEGFHRSVFAISSVSGGSVGTMVYDRMIASFPKASDLPCGKDAGGTHSYARCAQEVMRRDFLGPTFFNLFNADLVQRVLPGAALPDRATALETSWEMAWREVMAQTQDDAKPDAFAGRFPLRDGSEQAWRPVLLLNGASVKTGRRIITSDIAIAPACRAQTAADPDAPFLGTVDFFCLTRRPISASTAAHNSARFPYVSPAGTLWARDNAGNSWKADRIVDGGYFETHGAITALNVASWAIRRGYKPIVLALDNDLAGPPPDPASPATKLAEAVGPEAAHMGWWMRQAPDITSPLFGLVASRSGHGEYATERLKQDTSLAASDHFVRLNVETGFGGLPKVDPAMSWFLSDRSLDSMNQAWCNSGKSREAQKKVDAKSPLRPLSVRGYDFAAEIAQLGRLLKAEDLNTKSPVCPVNGGKG